jgi:hypothetical protein
VSTQELLRSGVGAVGDFLELLARRRAEGECSSLYSEVRDAAGTIMYLRSDAPGYLQPDLAMLESRCSSLLRSIAN